MGGHSAWRKRVASGELAKKSGGAICRHRPHLGRKGKDRKVERKGNINGGPRKKKSNRARIDGHSATSVSDAQCNTASGRSMWTYLILMARFVLAVVSLFVIVSLAAKDATVIQSGRRSILYHLRYIDRCWAYTFSSYTLEE